MRRTGLILTILLAIGFLSLPAFAGEKKSLKPAWPDSHNVDWLRKHQVYAKQNPAECSMCHADRMFCIDCHQRRDSVQERVHKRNFKFFHPIEARANPRKCDACHTVNYCQECHAGRDNSKR